MLSTKAGLKNIGTVFLLTDAQVPDEQFLVLINDLLASGEIPGLFPDDEVENIIASLRNEVKGAGLQDTRENCWKFFIERVRRQLKVRETILYCSFAKKFRMDFFKHDRKRALHQISFVGSIGVV